MDETHQVFDHFSQDVGHDYSQSYNNAAPHPHDDEEMASAEHQHMSGTSDDTGNSLVMHAYQVMENEESMLEQNIKPRAVHQCPVCNKIFVSFKGLQQHAIIHTDQKPYACDICGKSFRFKSNLFEHRSVHTGNTPHQCPICGKTCRLKGNLKKHLRTHCTTKEELDLAWQPFASNRRAPAEIPQDAIIIRPTAEQTEIFTPLNRSKKKKLGLGMDAKTWVEKIHRGDLLPIVPIHEKMQRILDLVKMVEDGAMDMDSLFHHARAIPFERFECLVCKTPFYSRLECQEHIQQEHANVRKQRPHFCDLCLRSFTDRQQLANHQEHHKRIQTILANNEIKVSEPITMVPVINETDENEKAIGIGRGGQICAEDDESSALMGVGDGATNWGRH